MFRQSNCPSFTTRGSEGCHHLEMFPVLGDDEKLRLFFPTLTCGVFVFSSVSAFLRLPPPPPVLLFTHPPHSLTHSLPRGRMYALASFRCPLVSAAFVWQAWDNVHCQGVGCTPWRPLGLRLFCVAGVGQCALPRGRMYALASLGSPLLLRGRRGAMCTAKGSDVRPGVPWVSASFAWQAWDNVHCQGVGCTPWRPLGLGLSCVAGVGQCALPRGRMYALASLGSPPLLCGRRGTMCIAKGSDVHSLTHPLPHLTSPHPTTHIHPRHTYVHYHTHTYTDTQTHIPLLQRFNYFGRSLGDWL